MAASTVQPKTAVAMVGATGLTGSFILKHLLTHPDASPVLSLNRRAFPSPAPTDPSSKLQVSVTPDTTAWPSTLTTLLSQIPTTGLTAFISSLGTTRGDAGGVAEQRKIDYDLNLHVAQAARAANVRTYVLISSAYADATSRMAYVQMKGQLEDDVLKLGFERTVIVRPGLIVGGRERPRVGELPGHWLAKGLKALTGGLGVDGWAQDAEAIGRAAARVAVEEGVWEEGKGAWEEREGGKRVWIMKAADIIKFGEEKK